MNVNIKNKKATEVIGGNIADVKQEPEKYKKDMNKKNMGKKVNKVMRTQSSYSPAVRLVCWTLAIIMTISVVVAAVAFTVTL